MVPLCTSRAHRGHYLSRSTTISSKNSSWFGYLPFGNFLRILRLGGASKAALEYATHWHGVLCVCRQAAQTTNEGNGKAATNFFHKMVCVDSKYLLDSEEHRHAALSGVRAGTMYHVACLVKNRIPQHVVRCASDMWLAHSGVPETVVDQGCEFETTTAQARVDFVLDVRITGGHVGWHQGLVERHGVLFVEVGSAAVCEFHHLKGNMSRAMCMQAKNATLTRCGVTPAQTVFGRPSRWLALSTK